MGSCIRTLSLNFLFHSAKVGTEESVKNFVVDLIPHPKQVRLAPTFQVPFILCKQLRDKWPPHQFSVFLDSLFLNGAVAHSF